MDLAELVDALVRPEAPLFVVGHSMGGTLSTLYAGAFPERVARLAIIEGAGPPDNEHDHAPERMRRWIEEVRAVRARPERVMASREDAFRRLAINHPRVAPEVLHAQLHALARRPDGEREGEGGGGRLVWKADPLHGTRSPMPFFAESWKAFARRVTCPALFVSGGPAGWHPPDEEARLAAFAHLERVEIEDAGHMIHWTRPAQLVRALLDFLA
jgi:pimeloyl-ACP methyl ester carboxylesterase